ncbi:MAG: flagellar assembly protein FliW [Magnetococcales bacterium]|nr:flagellar assembly protein FliW [Magnetococcales bacterium]
MKVQTRDAGELEIDPETVLQFPKGIPGFENCTRFKLFRSEGTQEAETSPLHFWLQSLDDPAVVFSVAEPSSIGISYQVVLTDEEEKLLEIDPTNVGEDEVGVLVMLSKTKFPEEVEAPLFNISYNAIRPNFSGPLFLNLKKRLGVQKLLAQPQFSLLIQGF